MLKKTIGVCLFFCVGLVGQAAGQQDAFRDLALGMQKTISKKFTDSLAKCEVYSESYVHPVSNETLYRRILGPVIARRQSRRVSNETLYRRILGVTSEGKCKYEEDMPKGMKVKCQYPVDKLAKFAEYYEKVRMAKDYSFKLTMGDNLSIRSMKSVEMIDGVVVKNSSQTFLADGTCVIEAKQP